MIHLGCNHVPEVQGCLQHTGTGRHLEDNQSLVDGVALVHAEELVQFPGLVYLLLLHELAEGALSHLHVYHYLGMVLLLLLHEHTERSPAPITAVADNCVDHYHLLVTSNNGHQCD